jgi:hypothetical protein
MQYQKGKISKSLCLKKKRLEYKKWGAEAN